MNTKHSLTISFEDLFQLIIGLIVDDLKVQKHLYHLSLSGLDTSALHLDLHKRVFILAGFKDRDITEALEEWYFEQTKRVTTLDLVQDEHVLLDLSAEILTGLLKLRKEQYAKKVGAGG